MADESQKRPVNQAHTVDLQVCRSDLMGTKITLVETEDRLRSARSEAALRNAERLRPDEPPSKNTVVVVPFAIGSYEFAVSEEAKAMLLKEAQGAKLIVIRGRTDAKVDSVSQTRLAQRRADAAYEFLRRNTQISPLGIRVTWQGAGDAFVRAPGSDRRVEIEIYKEPPAVVLGVEKLS